MQPATAGLAFHSSVGTNREALQALLRQAGREPTAAICSAGNAITLHSVALRPAEGALWVAHGRRQSAHQGTYVRYDLDQLLAR